MFIKKRHISAVKSLASKGHKEELDKATEMELYILNFVKDGNLNDQGQKFYDIVKGLDEDKLPDVFLDTQILTMLKVSALSEIPEHWAEELKQRFLYDDRGITDIGLRLLKFVKEHKANVYITPEMLSLVQAAGVVGSANTLKVLAESIAPGSSQNLINALQAQKLLILGPKEKEVAYATTISARLLAKLFKELSSPIILTAEELEGMFNNVFSENLSKYEEGGAITQEGMEFLQFYEALEAEPYVRSPGYITEEELKVLETTREIQRIHENTPSILPTPKEIEVRGNIPHVRRKLYFLQFKGLLEFKEVEGKETYWLTKDGEKALTSGKITLRASRALAYALSNDVPAFDWYIEAVNGGLVKDGRILPKGYLSIKIGENQRKRLYLTKWDVILMLSLPKAKFVSKDSLSLPEDFEDSFFAEAEAKSYVRVLQNGAVGLTAFGKVIREAIEKANTQELKEVEFSITPVTYDVLRFFYDNRERLSHLWRSKGFNRMVLEVVKGVPYSLEEVKKSLVILRGLGFLGDKSIREPGKMLVEAFEKLKWAGSEVS